MLSSQTSPLNNPDTIYFFPPTTLNLIVAPLPPFLNSYYFSDFFSCVFFFDALHLGACLCACLDCDRLEPAIAVAPRVALALRNSLSKSERRAHSRGKRGESIFKKKRSEGGKKRRGGKQRRQTASLDKRRSGRRGRRGTRREEREGERKKKSTQTSTLRRSRHITQKKVRGLHRWKRAKWPA